MTGVLDLHLDPFIDEKEYGFVVTRNGETFFISENPCRLIVLQNDELAVKVVRKVPGGSSP